MAEHLLMGPTAPGRVSHHYKHGAGCRAYINRDGVKVSSAWHVDLVGALDDLAVRLADRLAEALR